MQVINFCLKNNYRPDKMDPFAAALHIGLSTGKWVSLMINNSKPALLPDLQNYMALGHNSLPLHSRFLCFHPLNVVRKYWPCKQLAICCTPMVFRTPQKNQSNCVLPFTFYFSHMMISCVLIKTTLIILLPDKFWGGTVPQTLSRQNFIQIWSKHGRPKP